MAKKKIEVTINPDGTVEGEAMGHEGDGCMDALRGITSGMKRLRTKRKPEFFRTCKVSAPALRYGGKETKH